MLIQLLILFQILKKPLSYCLFLVPEEYRTVPSHPDKICESGNLAFQCLPVIKTKLRALDENPNLVRSRLVSSAQIEASLHIVTRWLSEPVYGYQPGFVLGTFIIFTDYSSCLQTQIFALRFS